MTNIFEIAKHLRKVTIRNIELNLLLKMLNLNFSNDLSIDRDMRNFCYLIDKKRSKIFSKKFRDIERNQIK